MAFIPGSSAVEQTTVNRLAGGSNPSRGATFSLDKSFQTAVNCVKSGSAGDSPDED